LVCRLITRLPTPRYHETSTLMHPLQKRIKNTPEIKQQLLNSIEIDDYQCTTVSFVNPFSYQLLRKNEKAYQSIDHFYSDGIISCYVLGTLLGKKIPRVSFDYGSFAKTFFKVAAERKLPVFIVGSKEEQLQGAIKQFTLSYPSLNICGSHNGYFSDDTKIIEQIKKSGAQYVICGLGTPKQDIFAGKIKEHLPEQVKQIYTCGGFLHQSENRVNYYPDFINKYNLRWLYRAINEPQVAKRLITKYPLFAFYALWDRFLAK